MKIDLSLFIKQGETIAVALSGGSDSMALLYYMREFSKKFHFSLVALNVEHGIRGEESIADTEFVKKQCELLSIPLYCYSVKALDVAEKEKLSIEQSARKLRYECFYKAIAEGKCDKVATAHHADDNLESVLFNLLRGTGIKGLTGIKENYNDKIIRPFLPVCKKDIEKFVLDNNIPFVTDSTNLSDKYSRNHLRLNVIPQIEKIFPDAVESVLRLSKIALIEDEYMDSEALKAITNVDGRVEIALPLHKAIFSRAVIIALKLMGVEKDWAQKHVDDVYSLIENENGSKVHLPKGIIAIREYSKIAFYRDQDDFFDEIPFTISTIKFNDNQLNVIAIDTPCDLKSGLFGDANKIPQGAIIRTKRDGDRFTKFGGGSKSLGDYMTDKKIPLRKRNSIPLLAHGSEVLCIFGVAVSDKIKVDDNTTNIIKFVIE